MLHTHDPTQDTQRSKPSDHTVKKMLTHQKVKTSSKILTNTAVTVERRWCERHLFQRLIPGEREERRKKKFSSLHRPPSTTDFAHPLWLSYALSCSRRRQMPSRPLQLAGLSLEPVYQQGYLTASAAPEASDSPSGWEGCQQSPWKERWERERERGKKTHTHTHNEIRRHHSSEPGVTALFQSHHFGDKNKPNYPLKKGHGVASLMMFTVGLLARLRKSPRLWRDVWYNVHKAFG